MTTSKTTAALANHQVYLIANGDLRLSANQNCWEEQSKMEAKLSAALASEGRELLRAHPFDESKGHGFIDSQKMGLEVFRGMDPQAPLIVAESVWQYSQHILPGLYTHQGPILTVANWSGAWPGLVGLLNLNGSLLKMGKPFSSLWSLDFNDDFFLNGLRRWLSKGVVPHDQSHVTPLNLVQLPEADEQIGRDFARRFRDRKAIMGVFDEGCMGMYNAIIPDELLSPLGVFKERLSQSALYAATREISDASAQAAFEWLKDRGMSFQFGSDEAADLTEQQTLTQLKMYIAALHIADEFGCDTIGIQYQQGLKDLLPASDLVEGLLNNRERPPVQSSVTGKELFPGAALPHFNEVDECAGLDGLLTYRLWSELGWEPENTLHDLRWGQSYQVGGSNEEEFIWVFLISGAAPAAHFVNGYQGASSERQPPMYFRLGGGSLKGISKPGWIVWSRIYVVKGALRCDIGVARVVELPTEETERRWQATTPQWPIMHAALEGISRDQMMARHPSNHIQVVYVPDELSAHRGARIKAAMMDELGVETSFCGEVKFS
jgi:hypothetical protein